MERREFIRSSCNFCLLGAAGLLFTQLPACSHAGYKVFQSTVNDNAVAMPLTLFTESTMQIVRPTGWYYDIAVIKKDDHTYEALLLQCTHQENQLTPEANGFHCNLHGSRFDKDGRVRKGPAERPLKQFNTSVDKGNLIIHL